MLRLLALALLAAAAAHAQPSVYDAPLANPPVWPECRPGQIEVMLLGTVHMANPGLDRHNPDVDDVRTPRRQAELDALVDRLVPFRPDKVMVEWVLGTETARADSAYAAYLAAGGRTDSRDEVEQVGFRLARRLGHARVDAVDYARDVPYGLVRDYVAAGGRVVHTMDYARLVPDRLRVDEDSLLRASTMTDFHAWLNDDVALRGNHFGMFALLGAGAGDAYPGADLLEAWYGRNLRIAHHLLRQVEPGDRRVVVLMGAGHVRALRHLLDEAPQFCPVSPLPYLAGER